MTQNTTPSPLHTMLHPLAQAARSACRPLARAPAAARSKAIAAMADHLEERTSEVLAANAQDVAAAQQRGMAAAMRDRLTLDAQGLAKLASALREIAAQADPVGATTRRWTRPNGLEVRRVRLPLGVILMIYESRPNVTCDAAALCIRSGNAVILRGGSEAAHTNLALSVSVRAGLEAAGLPADAVVLVPTQDRDAIDTLITFDDCIDLVIPRGGEGLIRRVASNSRIPVLQHYKGVCHVYVDAQADLAMAENIAQNAKIQRPGVCNAMETLLVDRLIAPRFLPGLVTSFVQKGVEIRGCATTVALAPEAVPATDRDWDTEFLSLILAIRVVDGVNGAVEHIDRHGTQHTASIVSQDAAAVETFVTQVDASCVLVNASTRFNDGGELGLGAEMGISTTRLHAYGPMGAESLTSEKFVVVGQGQIRT